MLDSVGRFCYHAATFLNFVTCFGAIEDSRVF
ncbi:hypothetical protein SPOA0442 (plasmid) [Ruegeria pomeroyi DSS-3]|uniref:Uncharacterized protein n=1 Tax=Ruegeria pomeroyi (strain ATCC 700808 / DSM 15171 / DSS-3) TaxID=246200 RepID=Q5LKD9_RUEPO|nr:hypothetical protein SPOA0442 [Ruegeria pomeroyi DSS-3]